MERVTSVRAMDGAARPPRLNRRSVVYFLCGVAAIVVYWFAAAAYGWKAAQDLNIWPAQVALFAPLIIGYALVRVLRLREFGAGLAGLAVLSLAGVLAIALGLGDTAARWIGWLMALVAALLVGRRVLRTDSAGTRPTPSQSRMRTVTPSSPTVTNAPLGSAASPSQDQPASGKADEKGPTSGIKQAVAKFMSGLVAVLLMIKAASLLIQRLPEWQQQTGQTTKQPPSITPAALSALRDEQLYLLYELRYAYQFIMVDAPNGEGVAVAWGRQRYETNRRLQQFRAKGQAPELVALYTDLIAAIDEVTEIWVSAGLLKRGAVTEAESAFSRGTIPAAAGFSVLKQKAARNESAFVVPDDVIRLTEQKLSGYLDRARAAAGEMARRNGWARVETGLANLKADYDVLKRAVQNHDLTALMALAQRGRAERPRDPVAALLYCVMASSTPEASTQQRAAYAEQCYAAAALVPPGRDYDEDRGEILLWAATMMANVAAEEAKDGGSLIAPAQAFPQYATTAVNWFEAAEKLVNWAAADVDGEYRLNRAFALAAAGRPADALRQARSIHSIRKDDPSYAYVMTALLAKNGSHEESLKWLAYLLSACSPDLVTVYRSDPGLVPLRRARPAACEELFQVKYQWHIKWSVLNDDILLTNTSAFPLTNVVFSPTITSGGKVWAPKLKAERIDLGQTFSWPNAISVPGSRFDNSASTLVCDQTDK